jgi:hypothetical protein
MVPMDRARQDWFMSTQRREDHLRLALCKDRVGSLGIEFPGSQPREVLALAAGRTVPPDANPAMAATNSLSSDYRNQQLVRLVLFGVRPGSPPSRQAAGRKQLPPFPFGYPPIHSYADRARSHPTLPRITAAMSCRKERYDGKRDLHFQHAA